MWWWSGINGAMKLINGFKADEIVVFMTRVVLMTWFIWQQYADDDDKSNGVIMLIMILIVANVYGW